MLYVFILDADAEPVMSFEGIESRNSVAFLADDYDKALDLFLEWCDQNDLTEWSSHFEVVIPTKTNFTAELV